VNPDTGKLEMLEELFNTETHPEGMIPGQLYRADGTPVPEHWSVFRVGELVTLKGHTFSIAYMNEGTILLEPVALAAIGQPDPEESRRGK
jgi:hypothetical protein